jgi:capsular exopolysaccharide synthesis family protein
VPDQIYKPNKKANLFLGFAAGLSLGATLAFLIEYLDNTIKTPEEIRRLSGYASIGVIPEHRPAGPRPVREDSPPGLAFESALDLITHLDSRSPLAEAYKELRTATLLASPDQPPRTILVTSCLPQEGKSLTSLNLSIALAQAGKRVLLVDTDLRRPRLHRALRLPNDRGISTYLSGNEPIERLVRSTSVHGLDALPSGPIPPNPSELLASRNFLWLVREFAGESGYDHLVFDSPPLLSVADPVVIATVCDGTIIVVQSGKTPRGARARRREAAPGNGQCLAGVVLNSVAEGDRSIYYQARYYRHEGAEESERSTTSA